MNIVFTGAAKVDGVRVERRYLTEMARDRGHYVQKEVDYYTDLLVVQDVNRLTKKRKMAGLYNVKMVTPDEFINMMTEAA